MEPQIFTPTYELFLVVERVRSCLGDVARALVPLDRGALPEPLGSDIYYRRATDVALLGVRYDERLIDHATLQAIEDIATGAGLPVLDPSRLAERDRRRFYASYLHGYEVQIEELPGPAWALAELGAQLGLVVPRPPRRRLRSEWITPDDTDVPIFAGGADTPTPMPAADDDLPPLPSMPPELRGRRLGSDPLTPPPQPQAHQRLVTENDDRGTVLSGHGSPASGPVTAVEAVEMLAGHSARKRHDTAPATPLAKVGSGQRRAASGSAPRPALDEEPSAPAIDVRYLRGTEWLPARLRSLSLKGGFLVTAALPRNGDRVHIALGFRGSGAMISGEVFHVTPVEEAPRAGACGFAVNFSSEESTERRQLVKLLKRARDAGVTIKPPPSRDAVRFPVRWPVRVSTPRGGLETAALDVSSGGMFVRTGRDLPGEQLLFRVPLDNDGAAIRGQARAVRRVNQQMALERGLQTGYGMAIVELSQLDDQRWRCFLERVRHRTEHRILLGGSIGRVRALGDALMSCGYAVQGASDAATMMTALRAGTRPPDAALIDPTLSATRSDMRRIENALATLGVPLLSTDRELPARARIAVDRILEI